MRGLRRQVACSTSLPACSAHVNPWDAWLGTPVGTGVRPSRWFTHIAVFAPAVPGSDPVIYALVLSVLMGTAPPPGSACRPRLTARRNALVVVLGREVSSASTISSARSPISTSSSRRTGSWGRAPAGRPRPFRLSVRCCRSSRSPFRRSDRRRCSRPAKRTSGRRSSTTSIRTTCSWRSGVTYERTVASARRFSTSTPSDRRPSARRLHAPAVGGGKPVVAPVAPHAGCDAHHAGRRHLGVEKKSVTLEGSWFRGLEPDENRTDIDFGMLDSWAVRASWRRGPWTAQVSGAQLTKAGMGRAFL